jgi:hypothetical protein
MTIVTSSVTERVDCRRRAPLIHRNLWTLSSENNCGLVIGVLTTSRSNRGSLNEYSTQASLLRRAGCELEGHRRFNPCSLSWLGINLELSTGQVCMFPHASYT